MYSSRVAGSMRSPLVHYYSLNLICRAEQRRKYFNDNFLVFLPHGYCLSLSFASLIQAGHQIAKISLSPLFKTRGLRVL